MVESKTGEVNAQEADRRAEYARTAESGRLGDAEMDDVSPDKPELATQE